MVLHEKCVYTPHKPPSSFDARVLPVQVAIRGRGEQTVEPRSIGAIFRYHLVRANHIAQALRHLSAVFDHHALREQALNWFIVLHQADVAHELCPEARINQVQNGVLYPADVLIDGKPVRNRFAVEGRTIVVRVRVAVEIPR